MNFSRCERGFALIEFIFWMVVISLACAGIIPLVGQVFSTLHQPTEWIRAYFLARAVVEQMDAQTFDQISASNPCSKPDGTPWVGVDLPWTCQVDLWKAEPNFNLNKMECNTGQSYAGGDYLCATVTLSHRSSGEPVAQMTAMFFRPVSP